MRKKSVKVYRDSLLDDRDIVDPIVHWDERKPLKTKRKTRSKRGVREKARSLKDYEKRTHQKKKKTPIIVYDFIALLLFFAAVFIIITNISPNTTGLLGYYGVQGIAYSLIGKSIAYLPLFLIMLSLSLVFSPYRWRQALLATITSAVAFAILLEQIAFTALLEKTTMDLATSLPTWPPQTVDGGGYLGGAAIYLLNRVAGINGTWVAIIGVFSISMVALFEVSLRTILTKLFKFLRYTISSPKQDAALQPVSPSKPGLIKRIGLALFFTKKKIHIPSNDHTFRIQPASKQKSQREKHPAEILEMLPKTPEKEPETPPITVTYPDVKPIKKSKAAPPAQSITADNYKFPSLSLLEKASAPEKPDQENVQLHQERARQLEIALSSFNVDAKCVHISPGPTVTRYELKPGPGVKISKITGLSKDIALKLEAPDVRIEAPIPGKALIGIEVPNSKVHTVTIRDIIDRTDFMNREGKLTAAIGLTITGEAILLDLTKMPHILIAGATGSGKSVCVNSIILSFILRATPDEVKFLMIDPKKVELSLYEGIPHLLAPVVTDPQRAAATLKRWALAEMEKRYDMFSKVGVKHISGFNALVDEVNDLLKTNPEEGEKRLKRFNEINKPEFEELEAEWRDDNTDPEPPKKLPYIVVIIDELADLMMVASQEVESTICRLAQMSRATGIHLVIATQRPSVNVVTGLIKANVPSRISFFLQSQIDSRTILDMPGAEKLLGRGDMLYSPVGSFKPKRVQGAFVSEKEVKSVVSFLKKQGSPQYVTEIIDVEPLSTGKGAQGVNTDKDELYETAKEIVMNTRYASTSFLQRKLRIGYNRAARIMDDLHQDGIITEYAGEKKPRTIQGI